MEKKSQCHLDAIKAFGCNQHSFLMKSRFVLLSLLYVAASLINVSAQTNPAAQALPYSQNFSTFNGSSTVYPDGWQGWQVANAAPSSTGRVTSPASDRTISGGTAASTSSGVYDYNGKIGFLSVASADVALCLAVNTTGYSNIKITFDAMTIRNLYDGTSNYQNGLVLQYRVGTSGDFAILSYLPNEYLTPTTTQTSGTNGIHVVTGLNASLPSACDNQAVVQIRWIYRHAAGSSGSRPSMALDNVTVAEALPTTYTWNQTGTASFATATNWTPTRTTPQTDDILQFNGGSTVVATGLTSQTIGQLLISNNTSVELQSAAPATLTIAGATGTDLTVGAGSALNIAQTTNAITIAVGSGATGSIAGTMTYTSAAHKLTAAEASGITFQSGSSFTAGTGFSGNAFGASGSVATSVVFNSGSSYIAQAGANPFANNQPSSVVVFNAGSLYKITGNVTPSFSGRTYADLEIDAASQSFSVVGSFPVSINNLTVTNGVLNINMTNATNSIKGNISVSPGATLTFNPATAGTINLNGTSAQTISGGGTLTVSSLADFVVANDVIADRDITFGGALTINSSKSLTVNAGKQLTVSTAYTNNGTLSLLSSNENGTATVMLPATISGSGSSTVQQYLPHARNWYISSPVSGAVAPAGYTYYQRDEVGSSWTSQPFVAGNTFVAGKGYIALPNNAASTITFSGTLNNGDVNATLSKSGSGFNLIGNPYPGHLGWTYDFAHANSALIESSIWVRTNAGTTNNSNQWSFATFNAVSSESVPSVANAGIIAPMQAFWVKAKAAGTLTLNNNLTRSHQSSNPLKALAATNNNRQRLRLQVSNGTTIDETLFYFDTHASDEFDAYDSPKMFNNNVAVPEIYSRAGNELLVINGMYAYDFNTMIPLGFVSGQAGNFSIRASQLQNFESDTQIVLIDKNSNTQFNLTDGESYSFTSGATNTEDRFAVLFKSASGTTSVEETTAGGMYVSAQQGRLTLQMNTAPENARVTVFTVAGQSVFSQPLNAQITELNHIFKSGLYLIKIENAGKTIVLRKIVH